MWRTIWNDLLLLLFPETCAVCGNKLMESEKVICLHCLYKLPRTDFHKDRDNQTELRLRGKFPVEAATSLIYFNKGSDFSHLIHLLKYKNRKDIGEFLGRQAGMELKQNGIFTDVDCIIPIPLHKKKEQKRGYNQAEWIAKGLSETLNIPLETQGVKRIKSNKTQTRKSAIERWLNVKEIFKVANASTLRHKHILIVDDVLTTGATIESCATTLLEVEGVKVSVFTLGLAILA
ncbi:MAG: ComF family protein [Bacteroidota bacterium]|nr:ComF family protein [Bacteroidota bacterium]